MLRRINDALPGLVLGIIVYGVIVELAGVWFVTDKVRYTTGLLIGISLACGMAVNIATVLRDAVELYGEDNEIGTAISLITLIGNQIGSHGGNGEHISVQICLIGRFLNCVIWIRKNVIRPSASVVP